jgi:PBP1b-binding outer membrane lipoprotein LpoB
MRAAADSPRRFLFDEKTMNRMIVAGTAALFLVACSKSEAAARDGAPAPAAATTNAKVVMEIGQDI